MSTPSIDPRAATPVYGWHVPISTDAANIPYDMNLSLTQAEATVGGIDNRVDVVEAILTKLGLSGKRVIGGSTVAAIAASGGISIPYGYTFASPPIVTSCIVGDENANYAFIQPVQASVTTVQFQARVYKHDGTIPTSGTVRVNWSVIGTAV